MRIKLTLVAMINLFQSSLLAALPGRLNSILFRRTGYPKKREDLTCCPVLGMLSAGFVRVLENLESPGILFWHFPGLESPGKRPLVLESSGNLLNSAKKYEVYGRQ